MMLLLLAACGVPSDFCEHQADWRARCLEPASREETRACEQSLRGCSETDLGVLDEYATCLDATDCTSEGFFECAEVLAELQDPQCGFGE